MKITNKNYAEVLGILNNFDKDEVKKIPENVIEYITNNASNEKINLDCSKNLEEQISKESLTLLTYIIIKYAVNDEQKVMIKEKLVKKQSEYESEKRNKFKKEDLFDKINNNNYIKENENIKKELLLVSKQNFWTKIKRIMLNLFK
ncbi:MAG: hypothetical protein IKL55_02795 [Clostridia bacterium]|nr:hypothetical protein [Clostridia bacterium]